MKLSGIAVLSGVICTSVLFIPNCMQAGITINGGIIGQLAEPTISGSDPKFFSQNEAGHGPVYPRGGDITTAHWSVIATGYASSNSLGLSVGFTSDNPYPNGIFDTFIGIATGEYHLESVDNYHLVAGRNADGSIVSGTPTVVTATLDGTYQANLGPTGSVSVALGLNQQSSGLDVLHHDLPLSLSQTVSLDGNLGTYVDLSLGIAFSAQYGFFNVDVSHTFQLTSIKLQDGTTPESHGYDIVFDSGRISPNLMSFDTEAVPEPASLIIWGLGGLGCVIGAFRRRQKQA